MKCSPSPQFEDLYGFPFASVLEYSDINGGGGKRTHQDSGWVAVTLSSSKELRCRQSEVLFLFHFSQTCHGWLERRETDGCPVRHWGRLNKILNLWLIYNSSAWRKAELLFGLFKSFFWICSVGLHVVLNTISPIENYGLSMSDLPFTKTTNTSGWLTAIGICDEDY